MKIRKEFFERIYDVLVGISIGGLICGNIKVALISQVCILYTVFIYHLIPSKYFK